MSRSLVTLAQITVTATAARVFAVSTALPQTKRIYFSAPSTNTADVIIGDANATTGRGIAIPKGTTQIMELPHDFIAPESLYVIGTANDKLNVSYL